MTDLKVKSEEIADKVKLMKIYNEMLVLKKCKILTSEKHATIEGYLRLPDFTEEPIIYKMYFNKEENIYALFFKERDGSYTGFTLDYSDEEMVESLVKDCRYLKSSDNNDKTNGYRIFGYMVIAISLIGAFIGEGSGLLIITIPGVILSALFFGIGKILDEIQGLKDR